MDDSLRPLEKPEDPEKEKKPFEKASDWLPMLLCAGVGWLITGKIGYGYVGAFFGYCGWALSRTLPQDSRLSKKVLFFIYGMAVGILGLLILVLLRLLVFYFFGGNQSGE